MRTNCSLKSAVYRFAILVHWLSSKTIPLVFLWIVSLTGVGHQFFKWKLSNVKHFVFLNVDSLQLIPRFTVFVFWSELIVFHAIFFSHFFVSQKDECATLRTEKETAQLNQQGAAEEKIRCEALLTLYQNENVQLKSQVLANGYIVSKTWIKLG